MAPRPRRWLKRTTYLAASGLLVMAGAAAFLHTRTGGQWMLRRVDGLLREETGLGIRAREARIYLPSGRLLLEGLDVGDGLFTAERLEVGVDLLSLIRAPRVRFIHCQGPVIRASKQYLDALKLKPSKPSGPARWWIERITVKDGRFVAGDPAWGPFHTQGTFQFEANGTGPGRLEGTWRLPNGQVRGHGASLPVSGFIHLMYSEPRVEARGELSADGQDHVSFQAAYLVQEKTLEAEARAEADVSPFLKLLGSGSRLRGRVVAQGRVSGNPADPVWNLTAQGRDLTLPEGKIDGAALQVTCAGKPGALTLQELQLASPEGQLHASGQWSEGRGTTLDLEVKKGVLNRVGELLHVPALKGAQLDLRGTLAHPQAPWQVPDFTRVRAQMVGNLTREGQPAGTFRLETAGNQLLVREVALDLPDLQCRGEGQIGLRGRRVTRIEGVLQAATDAKVVADTLDAWHLIEWTDEQGERQSLYLDMGGAAQAQAHASWDPASGLLLTGWLDVARPRWSGAVGDRLRADVSIIRDELRLNNLEITKDGGRGEGSLWLTWGEPRKDGHEFDLCMGAFRIPLAEALQGGGLDLKQSPVGGAVSGWASLTGPYSDLRITGSLLGEHLAWAQWRLPAVSTDVEMDVNTLHLRARDLRIADHVEGLTQEEPSLGALLALRGDLMMDLERLNWRGEVRGALDSRAIGAPGARFQAQVDARLDGPMVVSLGPLDLPAAQVALHRGRVFFGEQSLEGLDAFVSVDEGGLEVRVAGAGQDVSLGGEPLAELRAWPQGKALLGAASLNLGGESTQTGPLAARLSKDLMSDLRVQGRMTGTWQGPNLQWQGSLQRLEGAFTGFSVQQSRPTTLSGTDAHLGFDMELAGAGDVGTGATLRLTGTVPFGADQPVNAQVAGDADIARIKAVVDAVTQPAQGSLQANLMPAGNARLDLILGGTWRDPSLKGHLFLKGGQLRVRTLPQSAEDLSFDVQFDGRRIVLPEAAPLTGRLASGALTAHGVATWGLQGLETYELQASLTDFQFRDAFEGFDLRGSAAATFTGDAQGGTLRGTVDAKHLLYRADLNLADVILASAQGGGAGFFYDPENPLRLIDLDLDLRLTEPWQFDTNLLKLQGRPTGRFRVMGTLAQPGLMGTMAFEPGGRITNLLPAGDVVLESGSVDFNDPRVFNPILNLKGRVDVAPFVVNLSIRGPLDRLVLNPTSTPSLRQEEIWAILVDPSLASSAGSLGSGAAGTAAYQGLTRAGTGILSTLAIAGLQEQLRKTFSLDRVSFALRPGTGSPEMTLTAGKSLAKRTALIGTVRQAGAQATYTGQFEWRFGDFVFQGGISQSSGQGGVTPSGELRFTWSPR